MEPGGVLADAQWLKSQSSDLMVTVVEVEDPDGRPGHVPSAVHRPIDGLSSHC